MENWKQIATVILGFLVFGFILYRMDWRPDRKNVPIDQEGPAPGPIGPPQNFDYGEADQMAREISEASEFEIASDYKKTEDLREQIINNHLKASKILKPQSLIPRGLLPAIATQSGGGMDNRSPILKMDTETSVPCSKISDPSKFTDLPNFFNNELPGSKRAFPL